jgi:hypothetical protein
MLLAAALAAFGASLGSGFHFDDYAIFSDPALTSPGGWLHIWAPRQTRPLTYLTYWLNFRVGGTDALGYHALNLVLHLAAVWLAFECLRRMVPARVAWMATAIFAIHPLQAESVDYIWGRSMVLATVLCFASLLAWITGRPWISVACFAAALLAKEECAAFPLALVWLMRSRPSCMGDVDVAHALMRAASRLVGTLGGKPQKPPVSAGHPDESGRGAHECARHELRANRVRRGRACENSSWWPIGTMILLSLAAGLRVIWAAALTPGAQAGTRAGITPADYGLAQGVVILRYLRMLAIPWGFTIDPDIRVPPPWLGALAWAAILTLVVFAWRRRSLWGIWLIAGLVLLLPSSSVFPAADLAADRRMYLPLLAFAVAAAALLDRVPGRLVICAALLGISLFRTQVWRSDEALWREALAQAPEKVRPRIQLARAVAPPEALRLLDEARRLAPNDPAIATETGRTLLAAGNAAAALSEFGRALALDPHDADNYNNRGVALAALGQTDAARLDFERALALSPGLTSAAENLRRMGGR